MAASSNFDPPVRDFLAFARVEAGLAAATLEAYARDLADLVRDLEARGITDPATVQAEDLAEHLRSLSRARGMQPTSIARHLATAATVGMQKFSASLNASERAAVAVEDADEFEPIT